MILLSNINVGVEPPPAVFATQGCSDRLCGVQTLQLFHNFLFNIYR